MSEQEVSKIEEGQQYICTTLFTAQRREGYVNGNICVRRADDPTDLGKIISEAEFVENYKHAGYTVDELVTQRVQLGFDVALQLLKDGYSVTRSGWCARLSMFEHAEEGCVALPYILIHHAETEGIWEPSTTDVLAEDWMVLGDAECPTEEDKVTKNTGSVSADGEQTPCCDPNEPVIPVEHIA